MTYTLTKQEVEKLLGKSGKTISRYIKDGKLNPVKRKGESGHLTYLFSLQDIEALIGGHTGQLKTELGTSEEIQESKNVGRVNTLNKTEQGTNDKQKDTIGDIEDRTQGTQLIALLKDTIDTLKAELEAKNKQISEEKQHSKDLVNSLQFAQNEAKEYRQMLALPMPIIEKKHRAVVGIEDTEEGTDGTKQGTNGRTKKPKKVVGVTKEDGQKESNITGQNKKGFNLFSWLSGKK